MAADMKKLREQIDKIDAKILKLYEERMDVVSEIGKYKIENNLPVYDASREDAKLEEVFASVSNKHYADGAAQLFITLMQTSREMQEDMAGLGDYDYDDFNWDGEPVELSLEILGNKVQEE
ncbi:MAG: chorismate mutase [Lachnospiraceae bacterium]|nr:chorismate mutase [Lachnospiraceae bacterium]